jgi:hypothetical protein
VKIYPAEAFYGGTGVFLRYLIAGLLVSVLLGRLDVSNAEAPGFLEGRLKIVSPKEVKLAHESPAKKEGKNYADYPLVVLAYGGIRVFVVGPMPRRLMPGGRVFTWPPLSIKGYAP